MVDMQKEPAKAGSFFDGKGKIDLNTMTLKIQNIFFSYDEKPTLNDITFEINKGENIAIHPFSTSHCGGEDR